MFASELWLRHTVTVQQVIRIWHSVPGWTHSRFSHGANSVAGCFQPIPSKAAFSRFQVWMERKLRQLASDIWQLTATHGWHLTSGSQVELAADICYLTVSQPTSDSQHSKATQANSKATQANSKATQATKLLKNLPSHALPHIILNFKKARPPGKQCLDLVGVDGYKLQALPPKMGHDQHKISHMYMTVTFEPTKLFLVRELVVRKRETTMNKSQVASARWLLRP